MKKTRHDFPPIIRNEDARDTPVGSFCSANPTVTSRIINSGHEKRTRLGRIQLAGVITDSSFKKNYPDWRTEIISEKRGCSLEKGTIYSFAVLI